MTYTLSSWGLLSPYAAFFLGPAGLGNVERSLLNKTAFAYE